MRDFLAGVSVGAVLAAGGLAMWSLSVPLPETVREVAQTPPAAPAPVAEEAESVPDGAPGRDADLAGALPTVPQSRAERDDLSALEGADLMPARKPDVGSGSTPAARADLPAADPGPGRQPSAGAAGPEAVEPEGLSAPQADNGPVVVTVAPRPPAQQRPGQTGGTPGSMEAPRPAAEVVAGAGGAPEAPAIGQGPDAPRGTLGPANRNAPQIGSAPEATHLPAVTVLPGTAEPDPGAEAEAAEASSAQDEGASGAAEGPGIGTPVVPLTERAATQAEPSTAPFADFSVPFSNPEGRPLMSIVLIDAPGSLGAEALADFPYPLSIAIDPDDPEAERKMAMHRAAGFEVLLLTDLPRNAAPQDAETALEVWRTRLPEAVAILEGVETGIQGNRPLADQVTNFAAAAGYGLLTQNSGLNTVQKLALREGVPAGVVFRDFDGAGQDPRAIRRFLDQAAFRARQEGAVTMLGRLKPDTVSALLIWGLQDRANQVALAPVSATLEAQLPEK
ncbi:divergent polysaccharide deacetylase family protein [Cribrihabitans neustonicus]|uniref:divergent polysaccharide deacetylase family protein n=1 Tax=Cribrihabitans neustonicus TaxID=1429085 RepID=UPI003B58C474